MREREMRRRLQVLERLPQFQPPPSPLEQIGSLALKQMSNEDLELLTKVFRDGEAGVCWTPSPSELATLERREAALETEARRMGFRSFADAERRAGRRR
jgi:hypothetical protein